MNALLTPFRQLVDRKLWPLAILLVAAIAAVPMLLAKDDAAPGIPTASVGASATGAAQSPTQPIVTLGQAADREAARKVLGARKNPFEPEVKQKKAEATTSTAGGGGDKATSGSGSGSGSATGSGDDKAACVVTSDTVLCKKDGFGPDGSAPGTAGPARRTYELYQLKIRFGSTASEDLANRSVKRLTALPRMADPVLVYLGLKKDQRTAVFLVDANTLVVGDGRCVPSPTNCQNLELKKGQTAFIDVLDPASGASTAQYQLDYVKVLKRTTTDPKAAKAARRSVARGGRDALRANISRVNGWNYDPDSGVLVEPGE